MNFKYTIQNASNLDDMKLLKEKFETLQKAVENLENSMKTESQLALEAMTANEKVLQQFTDLAPATSVEGLGLLEDFLESLNLSEKVNISNIMTSLTQL